MAVGGRPLGAIWAAYLFALNKKSRDLGIMVRAKKSLALPLSNFLVRRPDRTGRKRIGIVSERGRGRSREQATTTATAAGEPLAGSDLFVKDMECRQSDVGNFLVGGAKFRVSLLHCATAYPLQA